MLYDISRYPPCDEPDRAPVQVITQEDAQRSGYSWTIRSEKREAKASRSRNISRIAERKQRAEIHERENGFNIYLNGANGARPNARAFIPLLPVSRSASGKSVPRNPVSRQRSRSVWVMSSFDMKCSDGDRIRMQPPMIFEPPPASQPVASLDSETIISSESSSSTTELLSARSVVAALPASLVMSDKLKLARDSRRRQGSCAPPPDIPTPTEICEFNSPPL